MADDEETAMDLVFHEAMLKISSIARSQDHTVQQIFTYVSAVQRREIRQMTRFTCNGCGVDGSFDDLVLDYGVGVRCEKCDSRDLKPWGRPN